MKRLFAFLALFPPICLFAQGFGSFSHDQPFFAKDRVESTIPGIPPILAYHWKSSDISSNSPISIWYDKVSGFPLVQTNALYQPTNNSTYGVCFDGSKSLEFLTTLLIPTNSSVFVSGYFSGAPHNQIVVYSTNGNEGFFVNTTNKPVFRFGGNDYTANTIPNLTNLTTIGYAAEKVGTNVSLVTFINGSQNSSNFFVGTNTSLDTVGGWSGRQWGTTTPRLDYSLNAYITDIYVWTNAVLNLQNMIYLDALADATYPSTKEPFFNPNDISGMFLCLRADAPEISGTGGAGGHINGITVTNVPESCNPTADINKFFTSSGGSAVIWNYNTGPSSKPAFRNTGAGSQLFGNHSTVTLSQPNTYFFVFKSTNSTSGNQAIFDSVSGAVINTIYVTTSGTSAQMYSPSAGTFSFPYTITNWTVLTVGFNGASSFIRTNGVNLGTISGNPGTDPFKKPIAIGNDVGSANGLLGFYCEAWGYNGAMNTNDIIMVENALKSKYGLP